LDEKPSGLTVFELFCFVSCICTFSVENVMHDKPSTPDSLTAGKGVYSLSDVKALAKIKLEIDAFILFSLISCPSVVLIVPI